jgi:hypothetical protein
VVVGLCVVAAVVFSHAARIRLLTDDYGYLDHVQRSGWWHSGSTWDPGQELFRPLLLVWFAGLRAVFGLHPVPYHLATGALVVVAAVMVGLVARRLGLRTGAYAAGAFYGLHGAMSVPIAWTSAASSPMGVSFALGAIFVMLRTSLRWTGVVFACGLFLAGLMSREVVAVTPALLVIVRPLVEPEALGWKRRLLHAPVVSIPLWAVLVAYALVRRAAGFTGPTGAYQHAAGWHAVGNLLDLGVFMANSWTFHLGGLVATAFWLALVCLTAAAAVRSGMFQGVAGVVWALVATLPVVFLAVHKMDSYYVDLALVGAALAVGTCFEWLCSRLDRPARIGLGLVGVAALSVMTRQVARAEIEDDYLLGWASATSAIVHDVQAEHPDLSAEGELVVSYDGVPDHWDFLTHYGDLFRVISHDPDLVVTLVDGEPVDDTAASYRAARARALSTRTSGDLFTFGPTEARCIADREVAALGVDRLRRYRISASDLASADGLEQLPFQLSEEQARRAAAAFTACDVDYGELFTQGRAAPTVVACINRSVDPAAVAETARLGYLGDTTGAGDAWAPVSASVSNCVDGG